MANATASDVSPEWQLQEVAKRIVTGASRSLKLSPKAVQVGKILSLAKCFSVTSDEPGIFGAIARQRGVKSMLEAEQSDILPHPVKRTAVL